MHCAGRYVVQELSDTGWFFKRKRWKTLTETKAPLGGIRPVVVDRVFYNLNDAREAQQEYIDAYVVQNQANWVECK